MGRMELLFFSSQVYEPIYLKTVVGANLIVADSVTLCLFPLTYACGALSDHIGRHLVVLTDLLLGTVSIFQVCAGPQQFAQNSVPVLALALVTGPQTALLFKLFPARTRYTAVDLPCNLAAG